MNLRNPLADDHRRSETDLIDIKVTH